jgi:nucleoside-diphosphate-sugar epimerase
MRVKDARQTFLGIWIKRLIEGSPVQVFGDGQQLRDFNFVSDVVDALLLVAVSPQTDGNVYNLGSSEIINLHDLAKLMIDIYGRGACQLVPFPADRKAIDIGDYYSDYSRIREAIGWEPQISLRQGLAETLAYYAHESPYYFE